MRVRRVYKSFFLSSEVEVYARTPVWILAMGFRPLFEDYFLFIFPPGQEAKSPPWGQWSCDLFVGRLDLAEPVSDIGGHWTTIFYLFSSCNFCVCLPVSCATTGVHVSVPAQTCTFVDAQSCMLIQRTTTFIVRNESTKKPGSLCPHSLQQFCLC